MIKKIINLPLKYKLELWWYDVRNYSLIMTGSQQVEAERSSSVALLLQNERFKILIQHG